MKDNKEYIINNKKYIITNELLVGQLLQLANLLKDTKLDFSNYITLLNGLGEKAPYVLAIALVPLDENIKDKDIEEISTFILDMPVLTLLDMVEDFFFKNKHLLQKFKQVLNGLAVTENKQKTI